MIPLAVQAGNEGRGFPVAVGCVVDQALAPLTPAVEAGHVGGGTCLVQEDEALAVHVALTDPPALTLARHVRTVLLGCPQALFLCVRPSRCSISATVERAFTSIPRSCSVSRISLSVIPGRLVAIDRSVSA